MQKLYGYVDENGMETKGRLFIVAVAALEGGRSSRPDGVLRGAGASYGKGPNQWRKAKHVWRLDDMRRVFAAAEFHGRLCYTIFRNTQDYEAATVEAISRTVRHLVPVGNYRAVVYVDALSKSKRTVDGAILRKTGLAVHKVQGPGHERRE